MRAAKTEPDRKIVEAFMGDVLQMAHIEKSLTNRLCRAYLLLELLRHAHRQGCRKGPRTYGGKRQTKPKDETIEQKFVA